MAKHDKSWVIATSASLLLHGAWLMVIVWSFIWGLSQRGLGGYAYLPPLPRLPQPQFDSPAKPPAPPPPDSVFGELDSNGESSPLSATGDQAQLAKTADQEQPEFTRTAGSKAIAEAVDEPSTPARFSPDTPAVLTPPHPPQHVPPVQLTKADKMNAPHADSKDPPQTKPPTDDQSPGDEPKLNSNTVAIAARTDASKPSPAPAEVAATAKPAPPTPPTPTPMMPATPSRPSPPSPPAQAAAQASAGNPGPSSDRDSDAFSHVEVSLTRDGAVVAHNGRPVKTVKPRFGEGGIADLDALGFPPITSKVAFDAAGNVTNVQLLNPTGHQSIDMPIKWSLYEWQFPPIPRERGKSGPDVVIITEKWE